GDVAWDDHRVLAVAELSHARDVLVGRTALRDAALARVDLLALEERMSVREVLVRDVVGREPLAHVHGELRVRGHHVVGLLEGLLPDLPVAVDPRLPPPVHAHLVEVDGIETFRRLAEVIAQRDRVTVHVDPYATTPRVDEALLQRDVVGTQALRVETL